MLFPENDAPVLKDWIVKRLENTSDADADILADYILALLTNAHDDSNLQSVFEEEITPFLKEDTKTFANDLTRAIKYKTYIPGAAPAIPPPSSSIPAGPALAGRKRGFHDRGDPDAPPEYDPFQGVSPSRRAIKQARHSGGYGNRGYIDPDRPQPVEQIHYGGGGLNAHAPPFAPTGPANMPGYEPAMTPLEAVRQLQKLQEQINMMAGMAGMAGGFFQSPQGFAPQLRSAPHSKRGRCRDYDTKGYCSRGPNCLYEHSNGTEGGYGSNNLPAPQISGQIQLPSEGLSTPDLFQFPHASDGAFALPNFDPSLFDFNFASLGPPSFFCNMFNNAAADLTQQVEYDPHNATIQLPQMALQSSPNGRPNFRRDNNRQGPGQRRPSRAAFSHSGPMNDRTQTKVVVENIPEENFDEERVREFFSQYGTVEEVTMMPYKRLAIVKFDNWNSANAAYRSPKVIFDNRFVKVFWYKEEKHADIGKEKANGSTKNGKPSASNGSGDPDATAHGDDEEEPLDMEEFNRKQEEAQKAYEEKRVKKQELEKQRAELLERQQELQAKQEAEKRRLNEKLGISHKATADPGDNSTGSDSKASAQTEVLRATLAKLQEEARLMGVNPDVEEDAMISTYSSSGYYPRGGGGGYYHGRGGYAARGSSFRGGRGGGRGNIHAAYAAFSLDNRPRKVALSGVDFSAPEKDEALRQHLFSLGEFGAEIEITPAMTRVTFSERKAAEKFFNSIRNKTFSGLVEGDEVEPSWVPNSAGPLPGSSTSKMEEAEEPSSAGGAASGGGGGGDGGGGSGADTEQQGSPDADMADAQGSGAPQDYDVALDDEWDIT